MKEQQPWYTLHSLASLASSIAFIHISILIYRFSFYDCLFWPGLLAAHRGGDAVNALCCNKQLISGFSALL